MSKRIAIATIAVFVAGVLLFTCSAGTNTPISKNSKSATSAPVSKPDANVLKATTSVATEMTATSPNTTVSKKVVASPQTTSRLPSTTRSTNTQAPVTETPTSQPSVTQPSSPPAQKAVIDNGYETKNGEWRSFPAYDANCSIDMGVHIWIKYNDGTMIKAYKSMFDVPIEIVSTDPMGLPLLHPITLTYSNGTLICSMQ